MAIEIRVAKFHPGDLCFTRGVLAQVDHDDLINALVRHLEGDWGDVPHEDKLRNDRAAESGGTILSVYTTGKGVKFWVWTEADHLVTTFLLPLEH